MILDFKDLPATHLSHFKGGEGDLVANMYADAKIKIMHGHLEPGASIGYHRHEENSEVIFLLSGRGVVRYDDTEETLLPGQVHYCPMGHSHALENRADVPLEFFAVVPEHH